MSRDAYLELYASESEEHLRSLNAAILELESSRGGSGLEEAFRSVHTLKGMSAAMGFTAAAELAHELEDLLEAVRQRKKRLTARLADRLLRLADELEEAVRAARADAADAADAAAIADVRLEADAPLKGVRAFLIVQRVREIAPVLGTIPDTFDDAFDGELRILLGAGADAEQVERVVRDAGDVASVSVRSGGAPAEARAAEAPAGGAGAPEAASSAGPRGPANGRRFLRVDLRRLDELADGMAELNVLQARLRGLADAQGLEALSDAVDRAARRVGELQETVLAVRMVPLRDVFDRLPRLVRDTARLLDKRVDLRLDGAEIELDRAIVDAIADPLVHLVRNAIDHGLEGEAERRAAGKPETGALHVSAAREQSRVLVRVRDDGRGIELERVLARARSLGLLADGESELREPDLLRILAHSGFSTAQAVTSVSGRGVGLDVVVERVRALGGSIELRSEPGAGTTFSIWLPLTLAVAHALRVRVGVEEYMIPLTHVVEAVELETDAVTAVHGGEALRLRGELLPLVRLDRVLGAARGGAGAAVVAEIGERRGALAVDALVGREQIVVKRFDAATGTLPIFTGVTLLADGRPALVLDPLSVF